MSRGVLYVVWGDRAKSRLQASVASLQKFHPDWPVHIHTLGPEFEGYRGLLEKARMNDFSPFDETLYLDADTTVMAPLDFGFEQAQRFGLACTICECPWARRYRNIQQRPDTVEYNTGVLFWVRPKTQHFFDEWKRLSPLLDSGILFYQNGQTLLSPYCDQAAFGAALESVALNPFVLPLNWNFRPQFYKSFYGPLKIWHDYGEPPQVFFELNGSYQNPNRLVDFHTVNWAR
jgi:hypothetical protein